jgi:hypothetical protein
MLNTINRKHQTYSTFTKASLCGLALLFAAAVLSISASTCSAAALNVYVGQSSSGAANGADCADAFPVSWLNSTSSWQGTIGPGTTVHLCGTISTEIAVQGSGTSSSPITILFEPGAQISVPYCDVNACIGIRRNSYIRIDGGTPCGWSSVNEASEGTCNGVIQATANGSNLPNQQSGYGITGCGPNTEIQNLGIYNIFVAVANGAFPSSALGVLCGGGVPNISIHDSLLHDAQWMIVDPYQNDTGLAIYNNEIYNVGHGLAIASAINGGSISGQVYGNYIHDYANWTGPGCPEHMDGIHLYGQATPSTVNLDIYNNRFGGNPGQCLTAQIFQESTTTPGTEHIFNNTLYFTSPSPGGFVMALGPTPGGTISIYNNSIQCSSANAGPLGVLLNVATFDFENNVVSNCEPLIWWEGGSLNIVNNNVYAGCTTDCFRDTAGYDSFAQWQANTRKDTNAHYAPGGANLDANLKPLAGSIAISSGLNLSSVLSLLTTDKHSVLRPAAGLWDAGALQSSGTLASSPVPPTGLSVTVH